MSEQTEVRSVPEGLEMIRRDLFEAASRRAGRRTERRRRFRVIGGSVAITAALGGAALAAVPHAYHDLFTPGPSGRPHPIDRCSTAAHGEFLICRSFVGTEFKAKGHAGKWVTPTRCTFQRPIERCQQPYTFTVNLSNPDHPRFRRTGK